jgi:hypothetical protein
VPNQAGHCILIGRPLQDHGECTFFSEMIHHRNQNLRPDTFVQASTAGVEENKRLIRPHSPLLQTGLSAL